jgi:hypothetical protein
MSDNQILLIEEAITGAIKRLLAGRVNEVLNNWQNVIPLFEFSDYKGMTAVVPVVALASCERTEKERIIFLDAYSLTITLNVPETADSELFCYGYASAVCKALGENPTLGGVADRVTVSGKKYVPPKAANCGQDWQVIISLRVTVEGNTNVS